MNTNPYYTSMYFNNYGRHIRPNMPNHNNDERFGFLGPFLLGGITGGLVAPLFAPRPYYQPPYYTNNYYYQYPPYYY